MNKPTVALDEGSFLLISDVHGEGDLLKKILKKAPQTDYRCFLGDAVGYSGSSPEEVLEILANFDVAIKGNHDALFIGETDPEVFHSKDRIRIYEQRMSLGKKAAEQIAQYTQTFRRGNILLFHGSPEDTNRYLFAKDIPQLVQAFPDVDLFIGGHMHVPRLISVEKTSGKMRSEDISEPISRHTLDTKVNTYVVTSPSVYTARLGSWPGYATVSPNKEKGFLLNFYHLAS